MLCKKGGAAMKDIPMFTTEYGVASLVLKEIPYKQVAYVKILSSLEPEKLLAECIQFCRMCGAEIIDATGNPILENYPLVTAIYAMQCPKEALAPTDACLFPVTGQTVPQWLKIYNERMAAVPNAAYMDSRDGRELLKTGDGYFVHRDGKLLGIGKAAGDSIDAIAATEKGMGETVVRTLAGALQCETVRLTVAATNDRALRLYERLGFIRTAELSRWYRVLEP
jgi:hypothetical protein